MVCEYVTVGYSGYAGEKAAGWLARRGVVRFDGFDDLLRQLREAPSPRKITWRKDGKYDRITSYTW